MVHVAQRLAGRPFRLSWIRSIVAADEAEVGALGQVLAQEPVGVLVAAALPGRVRVAEVDRDAGRSGESDVLGHLRALVPGVVRLNDIGSAVIASRIATSTCSALLPVAQVQQQREPGRALHQGPDRAAALLAQDEVTFPVPGNGAVLDLGRTFADRIRARF